MIKNKSNKPMIKVANDNTKEHLRYAKNNRQLHLVGVQEKNFVLCQLPDLDKQKY